MFDNLKELLGKCRTTVAQARRWPAVLRLVWEATGYWMWAWGALLLAQGLLPVATVHLTRRVVNELVRANKENWQPLLLAAAGLGAVMLLAEAMRSAMAWVRTVQSELFWDHIQDKVHEKSVSLDLAFYESPEFHDRLHRVSDAAGTRPLALLENLGGLLQSVLSLTAMAAVLLQYGIWLPLLLAVSALPALTAVLYYSQRQYEWRRHVTPDQRRMWYFNSLLTNREAASELRLFGLGGLFRSLYAGPRRRLREENLRLTRNERLAELVAGVVALLASGLAFVAMAWRTLRGLATLGDLALFVQAFLQGQQFVRTLLGNAGQIYQNTLFLGDVFEFLALEPKLAAPAVPKPVTALRREIRFQGVTFRYPGADAPALQDFNLVIPAGQIVAIVGRNGSGKSTLVKLLCRFYDPAEGQVEWDGADLREFAPEELRRQISAMFQEPVRYHATVAENISFAVADAVRIEAAAAAGGADAIARRLGYGRLLGREFDGGMELSVGEWQRLALARAFAREAPLVVLDEATSAMDSWAEAEWLRRLRAVAAGKTVVIISHRFTTAMQADMIHVMDAGRIVESGRHEELVRRGGLYAQSWNAQAEGGARG